MYITLDIGGTNTRVARFENLDPKSENDFISFATSQDYNTGLKDLSSAIDSISANNIISGIGISIAIPFDERNNTIFDTNLPNWSVKTLANNIKEKYNTNIHALNDSSAGALAEIILKNNEVDNNFVYLTWGTGIGGVTVERKNNEYHIYQYEPGHWGIVENGLRCFCGKNGCLEAYIGGRAIEKKYDKKIVDLEDSEWEEVFKYAVIGIENILDKFPAGKIILNGNVFIKNPEFIKIIENKLNSNRKIKTIFEKTNVGDEAPLYGALLSLDPNIKVVIHNLVNH